MHSSHSPRLVPSVHNGRPDIKGRGRHLALFEVWSQPNLLRPSPPLASSCICKEKVEDEKIWIRSSGYAVVLTPQVATPEANYRLTLSRTILWILPALAALVQSKSRLYAGGLLSGAPPPTFCSGLLSAARPSTPRRVLKCAGPRHRIQAVGGSHKPYPESSSSRCMQLNPRTSSAEPRRKSTVTPNSGSGTNRPRSSRVRRIPPVAPRARLSENGPGLREARVSGQVLRRAGQTESHASSERGGGGGTPRRAESDPGATVGTN